ncbi:MAG: hypothetical protein KC684_00515 [Candidatus Omnitrophica bacterium]|nr:hypothetical protein [Candidatus Omnitrophota bacterium]
MSHAQSSNAPDSLTNTPEIQFDPSDMLTHVNHVRKITSLKPRTYWCEFPFYTVIHSGRQNLTIGHRPEDLAHVETIEQKVWKKHQAHLKRLERFPLEKAEYYQRLKESHDIKTVRGLAQVTGEDWSYIARILKALTLAEPIKAYLKEHKNDPEIIKRFHLRVLLDIARQGEEKYQLARFSEMWGSFG